MERNEVFDSVLERLKENYDNQEGLIYIPKFIEDLVGEDKFSQYICEQLENLRIVTQQNNNGKKHKWTVMLNSKGVDWIEEYGNWSGYLETKDARKVHGLRMTSRRVEILNRLFKLKYFNKQPYWDSLNELISPNKTDKLEDIICRELEWITSTKIDGLYTIVEIDKEEAQFFMQGEMFSYLLSEEYHERNTSPLISLSVQQSQTQSQSQNVHISIVNNALETGLNKAQYDELMEIINSSMDNKKKSSSILDKLASFGSGVAASILANILTNPQTWQ